MRNAIIVSTILTFVANVLVMVLFGQVTHWFRCYDLDSDQIFGMCIMGAAAMCTTIGTASMWWAEYSRN